MLSRDFELQIKQTIVELKGKKREAERRLKCAEEAVDDLGNRLTIWEEALAEYQERHGLPVESLSSTVESTASGYASLGPTQMVERWASEHDGEVVVKDLVKTVLHAGAYKKYRTAYNVITATVKRRKESQQIGPGRFRLVQRPASDRSNQKRLLPRLIVKSQSPVPRS